MDWETLLAFTGIYFMMIGVFAHFLKSHKKLLEVDRQLMQIAETNQEMIIDLKTLVGNSDK